MGGIDEAALDRLSLVTEMTKHIRVRASGGRSTESELGHFSPVFVWLLRVRCGFSLLKSTLWHMHVLMFTQPVTYLILSHYLFPIGLLLGFDRRQQKNYSKRLPRTGFEACTRWRKGCIF